MTARKPVEEGCTGGIFCDVKNHIVVKRSKGRTVFAHIPLTPGQRATIRERRSAVPPLGVTPR